MSALRCITCYLLLPALAQGDVNCRRLGSLLDIFDGNICITSGRWTKVFQMESQSVRLIQISQSSLEVLGYGSKYHGSQIPSMNGCGTRSMSNE